MKAAALNLREGKTQGEEKKNALKENENCSDNDGVKNPVSKRRQGKREEIKRILESDDRLLLEKEKKEKLGKAR